MAVRVEVDLLRRLPAVVIVGMASTSVRESAERIRSAILASGFEFPRFRVVVSLGPADLRKEGTAFDLPIALGILAAGKQVPAERLDAVLSVGELSLGGLLQPIRGTLAYACLAREAGVRQLIVPASNGPEAGLVRGLDVRVATSLSEVVEHLRGDRELPRAQDDRPTSFGPAPDLRDVRGQVSARLALEVAAAGGHNLLLEGPPGCGKSMLAARLPGVLPALTPEEALTCTRVHSAAGLRPPDSGVMSQRPFRAPHHTVSIAGMLGNAALRPGEVSLAHHGVLFLDEFPEFPRHVRESLRAPMEDRRVVLSRAGGHVTLPASFMLVAAANPCPCGFWGHPSRPCICSPPLRERYRSRLSGPLADRIDLRVELAPVPPHALLEGEQGEASAAVRARVEVARERQRLRYGGTALCNAELGGEDLPTQVRATRASISALRIWLDRTGASARVGGRVLKVGRTLADIEGADDVHPEHIATALALRCEIEDREVAP